jgi:type II secretory pathway pseudopilin PulG
MAEKRLDLFGKTQGKDAGFTLIEVIVILGVITILVAILTPTVLKYLDEARSNRASEDVKTIAAVVTDLIKDTGQYPGDKLFGRSFIAGPGTLVGGGSWTTSSSNVRLLSNHLLVNDPDEDAITGEASDDYRPSGKFRWKGPYIQGLTEDPWGNAYQINASTLVGGNTSPTWVISAGPDASFQTSTTATSLTGDDVGIRIK